ncbi:MAG: hypothetical protein ACYDEQ_12055 [Desulfocucumaceae bacterium]
MDILRYSFLRYLIRTASVSIPSSGILGFLFFVLGSEMWMTILSALFGGFMVTGRN